MEVSPGRITRLRHLNGVAAPATSCRTFLKAAQHQRFNGIGVQIENLDGVAVGVRNVQLVPAADIPRALQSRLRARTAA